MAHGVYLVPKIKVIQFVSKGLLVCNRLMTSQHLIMWQLQTLFTNIIGMHLGKCNYITWAQSCNLQTGLRYLFYCNCLSAKLNLNWKETNIILTLDLQSKCV